jgi:hypothetical protein
MRSQVQRFPVDVHDIYEDARASMALTRRRRWPMALLTTTAALALGAAVGWLMVPAVSEPILQPPASIGQGDPAMAADARAATAASPAAATGAEGARSSTARAGWIAGFAPAATPEASARWPVILHRAGDGRFYADLSLDGHLVNVEADPSREATRLTITDLPPDAVPMAGAWEATLVVLEHHRLPAMRFAVADEPEVAAVIGADVLARHFMVEEQRDRLRLVPRQAGH